MMRPGGGKQKGSNFERATGRALSMWLTEGERGDLFARNVLSGGVFTNNIKKGNTKELGTPGDLMANHPRAFAFLSKFNVECKHKADIGLDAFLFDYGDKSFLAKTLRGLREQSHKLGIAPWVVAKQNLRPTILLTDGEVGERIFASRRGRGLAPRWSLMHNHRRALFDFDSVLACVDPARMLLNMEDWQP